MTFRCPVSESNDPLCSVLPVVLQFFYGFGGDARNLGVDQLTREKGAALQRKRAEEELTHDGITEMAVGLFEEEVILELLVGAEKSQLVFVAPLVLARGCERVEIPCLSNQVKRGVGQRDVFFQDGTVSTPSGQTLAQHKGVISESEDDLEVLSFRHAHMLLTSSGNL